MHSVEHKGKKFRVTKDGFLESIEDVCDEWYDYIREDEGIDFLTREHYEVLYSLQEYYNEHHIAPLVRILCQHTGFKLKRIYELFPSGPGKGACKMAGLPKPTGCV